MADRVGQQFGNYRLLQLLGHGGFAEVYLGKHIHLDTQAAIKILIGSLTGEEELEKFRKEARTVAALVHPNIIRVLEFGVEDGLPYLVMDYAPGGPLSQRHPSGQPVPLATVAPYVQQVAQGLQYAHQHQVIHRDVKPQNLLLGRAGEVLLSDFGISIVAENTTRQHTQGFAGTASYAAPEQIQGHPHPASDQYSLGMIVYEWLTGALPFSGSLLEIIWKQTQTPPPPLRERVPTISPAVEEVVLTALAKDPRERFGNIQAFATAFGAASKRTSQDKPAISLPLPPAASRPLPPLPASLQPPAAPPSAAWVPPSGPFHPPAAPAGSAPGSGPLLAPTSVPPSSRPTHAPSAPIPTLPGDGGAHRGKRRSRVFVGLLIAGLLAVLLIGGSISLILASGHPGAGASTQPTNTSVPTATPRPTFTPTANPFPPYTAAVPGPGCDTGGGQWEKAANTQVGCSDTGMTLTQPSGDTFFGEVFFFGPRSGYNFPQNSTVSFDVSSLQTTIICAGAITRQASGSAEGYGFLICGDGSWKVLIYDTQGHSTQLAQGTLGVNTTYHMQIAGNGGSQAFSVNGTSLYTLNDSTYLSTAHIGLVVGSFPAGSGGSCAFSNFVYTPMQ